MMYRAVTLVLVAGVSVTAVAQPPAAAPNGQAAGPAAVRILLVGDSTVTDDSGWGRGFKARWSDRVTCVNVARNGRSSKHCRERAPLPAHHGGLAEEP